MTQVGNGEFMLYEKVACPVCGGDFSAGDDVVVCPECGTPHHRECWKNVGRCVNESLHGEDFAWAAPRDAVGKSGEGEPADTKDETAIVCRNCGADCPPDTLVCPECGTSLGAAGRVFYGAGQGPSRDSNIFMKGVMTDPDEEIDGIKAREAAAYVQMRAGRYIPRFVEMSRKDKKLSWNWAGFFMSPHWFFYRKIYKAGILFLSLTCIALLFASIPLKNAFIDYKNLMSDYIELTNMTTYEELLSDYNEFVGNYGNLPEKERTELEKVQKEVVLYGALFIGSYFIPNFFAALYGDYIYKSKMVKEIKSMRGYAKNDKTFLMLAMRRGGVSFVSALGCFLLLETLSRMITVYFGGV